METGSAGEVDNGPKNVLFVIGYGLSASSRLKFGCVRIGKRAILRLLCQSCVMKTRAASDARSAHRAAFAYGRWLRKAARTYGASNVIAESLKFSFSPIDYIFC